MPAFARPIVPRRRARYMPRACASSRPTNPPACRASIEGFGQSLFRVWWNHRHRNTMRKNKKMERPI